MNLTAANAKPASVVSLADLKSQLSQVQTDIATAVSSLNAVKESAENEAALTKAAAEYDRCYGMLQTRVDTLRTNAVTIKATVKTTYEAWQKELTAMQSAALREKAQARFSESQKEFEKIIAKANEAKEKVLPFVSELKDINIFLAADLSDEAVKSLSNTIWKLGNSSKSVIGSIDEVKQQIDRTIKALPQK
jgi:cell division protein ZapA (FtsZ GTPase activity inhibitor)